MKLPPWSMLHRAGWAPIGAGVIAAPFLVAAEPALEDYHIYAGSTHAHTQFTWSHGEQWAGAAGGEEKEKMRHTGEGVQLPPGSAKMKPNWQQVQGPPA